MDFVRPGAVPALIGALWLPALAAGADCSPLDATYRNESIAARDESPRHLSDLTMGSERRNLFRFESRAPGQFVPTQPVQRQKVTHLASTVKVTHTGTGASFRFLDATGQPIVDLRIESTGRWTCNGARLERSSERTTGLGDAVRSERLHEVLERNSAGDLVYRETVSVVGPPGGKPKITETRFPPAR